jgi:hypothetical protein
VAVTAVILSMTTALVVILTPAKDLSAQLSGQSFVVTPDTAAATVGDSVTVRFRIRLHERDQLLDSIPQVVGALPPGVRILSIEKLSRSPARVYEGSARIAFYRPGRRPVPIFGLPLMRVVEGVSRATLASDSAFVHITPILAPGNPGLRDIQELKRRPVSPWAGLVLVLGLIAAGSVYLLLRRRPRGPVAVEPESPPEPAAPSPYDLALERLDRLEQDRLPARGNVAVHYETVAQVLRQYLEHAHRVGALERTTSELLWALPPHLTRGGLRDRCHDVLGEADLVKFAEVRPSESQAADFLRRARHLLGAWHETGMVEESVDALR